MPRCFLRPGFSIATALALATLSVPAFAQAKAAPAPALAPTRAALAAIEACLGPGDEALEQLRQGLVWGWNNTRHEPPKPGHAITPPPAKYLKSLQDDAKACAFAAKMQDAAARKKVLLSVQNDLVLKAADCHKFGMGRVVAVKVSTLRAAKPESGWAVYYKWICASFPTEEIRTPQLSSPAVVQLPPGEYTFRADRFAGGARLEKARPAKIIIGGLAETVVELAIE